MKVLVTRPAAQALAFGAAIEQAGFTPVYFPVIEVRPVPDLAALDRALEKLVCYDWIIFTSTNSVDIVLNRQSLSKGWPVPGPRVAAIGPKTARALCSHGVAVDYTPPDYLTEAILPGLGNLEGSWVLLPCAELADQSFPGAIAKAGGILHKIIIYQTLQADPGPVGLAALRSGVDIITLTSPSTVTNFNEIARVAGLDPKNLPGNPRYLCIGPVTHQAAVEAGLREPVSASKYTTDGLIEVLRTLYPENPVYPSK